MQEITHEYQQLERRLQQQSSQPPVRTSSSVYHHYQPVVIVNQQQKTITPDSVIRWLGVAEQALQMIHRFAQLLPEEDVAPQTSASSNHDPA